MFYFVGAKYPRLLFSAALWPFQVLFVPLYFFQILCDNLFLELFQKIFILLDKILDLKVRG